MADGRHFDISKHCYISATVRPITTKFGMVTHIDPLNPIGRQIFEFQKSKITNGRHFEPESPGKGLT